jgi:hypothetical protein
MIVASTANISCTAFDGAFLRGFYGRYACAQNSTPPILAQNGSSSDPSGDGGGVGVLSRAAFLAICIICPIFGLIFRSCVIWWLITRRRRHRCQLEALNAQMAFSQPQTQNGAPPLGPAPREAEKVQTMQGQRAVSPLPQQGIEARFPSIHEPPPPPTQEMETRGDSTARIGELDAGAGSASRVSELDARERALADRERQRHEQS